MYREVGKALCASPDSTVKGDNFESSGPLDPAFFLIHPTLDRLFQASVLAFTRLSKENDNNIGNNNNNNNNNNNSASMASIQGKLAH